MTLVAPNRTVETTNLVKTLADEVCYRGLDRVGQKLARGIADFLTSLMSAPARVSVSPVRIEEAQTDSKLVARQLVLSPLSATVDVALERATLMSLVDLYYGGLGTEDEAREQLSPAENRFLTRIAQAVSDHLSVAWLPYGSVRATLHEDKSCEPGPVAVQAFSISFPDQSEFEISCRYPLATLDAFPELKSLEPAQGEQGFADHGFQARLMGRALDVSFPLRAVFAEPEVPLARLMHLHPGDIIPVCLPTTIELTVAGLPFARGSVGESNGRAAISIDHL